MQAQTTRRFLVHAGARHLSPPPRKKKPFSFGLRTSSEKKDTAAAATAGETTHCPKIAPAQNAHRTEISFTICRHATIVNRNQPNKPRRQKKERGGLRRDLYYPLTCPISASTVCSSQAASGPRLPYYKDSDFWPFSSPRGGGATPQRCDTATLRALEGTHLIVISSPHINALPTQRQPHENYSPVPLSYDRAESNPPHCATPETPIAYILRRLPSGPPTNTFSYMNAAQ